jgi:glycosyltransferase involved in cell wall biosynthesis
MMIQETNSRISPDLLVTIFVPVFNGEKYLNETLTSIKNQTYSNIEVLLVDDSSTDGSKIILDKFGKEDNRFKVFVKKNGGMAACSWNFIMPEIKGDFTFYSSQDDIFSIDLVERMVKKQQETKADIVLPDLEYYYENGNNNKRIIGFNGNRNVVLTGENACEASLNWNIHGFALVKSSLLIEEVFPEDAYDSDDFITRKLFLKSNKVVFCKGIFYYRQDNLKAITKTFSKKNFYALNSILRMFYLLEENNFNKNQIINMQFSLLLNYLKFIAIHQFYDFDSKNEKEEIGLFLFDFRKKYFTQSFFLSNRNYAIKKLKLRFLLLLFAYKNDAIFKILVKVYSKRMQKAMFKKNIER